MRRKLSVLVKAFNEGEKIESCIRSCLVAVEGMDAEVILADSLSTDDTVAKAAKFPIRIVQIERQEDRGCGVGAQVAFQYSSGEYLYVIDGDMELPRDFLLHALDILETRPEVGGVGGQLRDANPQSDLALLRSKHRLKPRSLGEVRCLPGGGLYRRSAIQSAGSYLTHPGLHSFEELELGMRLTEVGWILWRSHQTAIHHRGHLQPAYSLLWRRLRSGYALGSGELVRACVGTSRLLRAIATFPLLVYSIIVWMISVVLFLIELSPASLSILAALWFGPVVLQIASKRSVYLGTYSVVAWHVNAMAALVGFFSLRHRRNPRAPIAAKLLPASHQIPIEYDLRTQGVSLEGNSGWRMPS